MILRAFSFSLVLLCGFSSSGCYVSWALRDSDFGKGRVIDETFKTARSGHLTEDGTFALKVGATYDGKGGQGSAKYLIADAAHLATFARDSYNSDTPATRVPLEGDSLWRIWPSSMEPAAPTEADLIAEIGPLSRTFPQVVVTMDSEVEDLARRGIYQSARRSAQVGPVPFVLADGTTVEIVFGDFFMEGRKKRNYWKSGLYPFAAVGAGAADLVFMPIWAIYNLPPNLFALLVL